MIKVNNIKAASFKDVYKAGATMPKVLFDLVHIDYNKPFSVFEISGPFTINQVDKVIHEAGYSARGAMVVLLIEDPWRGYNGTRYNIATYSGGTTVNIDYKPRWSRTGGGYIDNYYRKADFEKQRKNDEAHGFIIIQDKKDLAPVKVVKPDFTGRFKLVKVNKWVYKNGGPDYIGSLELITKDAAGQKAEFRPVYYRGHEITSPDEVIDKSGYIVNTKRVDLKNRAEALREARAKAAYQLTENAAELAKILEAIQAKKAAIIKELENAATAEALENVGKKLNRWKGLPDIMSHYENLVIHDKNKDYASIDSYKKAVNRINEALAEL